MSTTPENQSMEMNDDDFARAMENYMSAKSDTSEQVTDERLKEMNKKLPSWNLEPPHSFLK